MRRVKAQQARKNLRVCEKVSLGEKRFVAVVQVDEERFLIGGSSGSVSLLTRFHEAKILPLPLSGRRERSHDRWSRFIRTFCWSLAGTLSAAATKATPPVTATRRPTKFVSPSGRGGSGSSSWTIVALLTFLTLIPSLLMCMTPFARLLIVFHFLRQALGLQTTPSNQTLIGLALVLTFFLMQPVGASIYTEALEPLQAGQINVMDAVQTRNRPHSPVHDSLRSRKGCNAFR